MPVDTLLSNWAYRVMAALAWTLKAWSALRLPETGGGRRATPPRKPPCSEWNSNPFLNAFMLLPVHVVRTSRRIIDRDREARMP